MSIASYPPSKYGRIESVGLVMINKVLVLFLIAFGSSAFAETYKPAFQKVVTQKTKAHLEKNFKKDWTHLMAIFKVTDDNALAVVTEPAQHNTEEAQTLN